MEKKNCICLLDQKRFDKRFEKELDINYKKYKRYMKAREKDQTHLMSFFEYCKMQFEYKKYKKNKLI